MNKSKKINIKEKESKKKISSKKNNEKNILSIKKQIKKNIPNKSNNNTNKKISLTKLTKNKKEKQITKKNIYSKKSIIHNNYKLNNQKGGANIAVAAVDTIKSMIGLGVNIGKEIDAIMHMGRDFNKATNVKLPNQTTPDQSVTSTTSTFKEPTYPKAKV